MNIDEIISNLPPTSANGSEGTKTGKGETNPHRAREGQELLEALKRAELYLSRDRSEADKHHVTCPWADEHGTETRHVSTFVRDGSGTEYPYVVFKCSHAHSLREGGPRKYRLKDMRAWLQEKGHLETEVGPKGLDKLANIWASEVESDFLAVTGNLWFRYTGTHWLNVAPDDEVDPAIHLFLRNVGVSVSPKVIEGVRKLARTDLGIIKAQELNENPGLIPLRNGIYDLAQDKLLPHSRCHRFTYCLDYEFDPKADCPRFTQWLREVLVNEDGTPCLEWISLLEEWLGCCLTSNISNQDALVNVGEGSNGKGTFARVLRRLVGEEQCAAVILQNLTSSYHRASLMGKLVGFIDEPAPEEMRTGGKWLKILTGEDPIQARHPYGKEFRFRPTMRFVISCNTLPETLDLTRGYFRRLLIIEWRRKFGEADPWRKDEQVMPADTRLDHKLRLELPGIFNLALTGLRRLQQRGWHFAPPEESARLKEEYYLSQDTVAQFLDECCCRRADQWVAVNLLYEHYQRWCDRSGYRNEKVLNKDAFGKRLNQLGFPKARFQWDAEQKKSLRVRDGLKLGAEEPILQGASNP
jgi:putative DNA primase/helicase